MKIAVLSNLDRQCGNAQYGRDLAWELRKHFESVILEPAPGDADVIVVNWCPSVVGFSAQLGNTWKSEGRKVILINQQSFGEERPSEADGATVTVTHEPTGWSAYIPHGIPDVDDVHEQAKEPTVGTAGFYFRTMKRFDVVEGAIHRVGAQANFVLAPHPQTNSYFQQDVCALRDRVRGRVLGDFLEVGDVVRLLGWSTVNIFWFEEENWYDQTGQSGSVGLGLAARRPVIINGARKFRVLSELYADEVYVARTRDELNDLLPVVLNEQNPKKPKRILEDMSWTTTGKQYAELIRGL